MYNASYHPLNEADTTWILKDLTEDQREIARKQINAATEAKIRNYRITIVPPESEEKPNSGIYFDITNGVPSGSSNQ